MSENELSNESLEDFIFDLNDLIQRYRQHCKDVRISSSSNEDSSGEWAFEIKIKRVDDARRPTQ